MRGSPSIGPSHVVRSPRWAGLVSGDAVVVDGVAGRGQRWVFVAHVVNRRNGEQWVEVHGGRDGEMKGRSFAPDRIYPAHARRGARLVAASLAVAPQLPLR
ncbi:MAG: hypothetical protein ACP5PB_04110 [Acidimicrobiales bacterium]